MSLVYWILLKGSFIIFIEVLKGCSEEDFFFNTLIRERDNTKKSAESIDNINVTDSIDSINTLNIENLSLSDSNEDNLGSFKLIFGFFSFS